MKTFDLAGEEFAGIYRQGSPYGPEGIDVGGERLTPVQARRLAKWLLKAADAVVKSNKSRSNSDRKKHKTFFELIA